MIITLDVSGMADPTNNTRYLQHSSQDHMTTQVTSMRQSRVTFGEILLHRPTKMLTLCVFSTSYILLTVLKIQEVKFTLISKRRLYCVLFYAAEQSFPFRYGDGGRTPF